MLDDFKNSIFCKSGIRCQHCRLKDIGRSWRAGMAKRFSIAEIDFECPYGKQWNNSQNQSFNQPIVSHQMNQAQNLPQQDIRLQRVQSAPPPSVNILTNTQWNNIVVKVNSIGSSADKAQVNSIVQQSKTCGCRARFAGMQYSLWEKYKDL